MWIDRYEKKARQKFGTKPGDIVLTSDKYGVFVYQIDGECLLIKAVCGFGEYWDEFSTTLAKALCLKVKLFVTLRSTRAWARKYGYRFVRQCDGGAMMGKAVV